MMFIADFHIHSHYLRATSRECVPEALAWRKGLHVIGTGDFTHPAWRAELKEKLAPAGDGLQKLDRRSRAVVLLQGPQASSRRIVRGPGPLLDRPKFRWHSEDIPVEEKNNQLHALISRIIYDRSDDHTASFEIVYR